MTRSKPATLQAAITSGRALEISEPKSRVARLLMNTRAPTLDTACASLPPAGAARLPPGKAGSAA